MSSNAKVCLRTCLVYFEAPVLRSAVCWTTECALAVVRSNCCAREDSMIDSGLYPLRHSGQPPTGLNIEILGW